MKTWLNREERLKAEQSSEREEIMAYVLEKITLMLTPVSPDETK